MKNLHSAGFPQIILRKCLEANDPNGMFGLLSKMGVSKFRISNKDRRKAKDLRDLLLLKNNYMKIPERLFDKGVFISDMVMELVDEKDISKIMVFIKSEETKLNKVVMGMLDVMSINDMVTYSFLNGGIMKKIKKVAISREKLSDDEEENFKRYIQRYIVRNKIYDINQNNEFEYEHNKYSFFLKYFKSVFILNGEKSIDPQVVRDYVRMSHELGEKLNLKLKSFKRLEAEHNILSIKSQLKEVGNVVKVAKCYKYIDVSHEKYNIRLLETAEEVVNEGVVMKHCVSSYIRDINRGGCAIFHIDMIDAPGKGWTMEVNKSDERKVFQYAQESKTDFIVSQVRGYRNEDPPKGVKNDMYSLISKIEIPDEDAVAFKELDPRLERVQDDGDEDLPSFFMEESDELFNNELPF